MVETPPDNTTPPDMPEQQANADTAFRVRDLNVYYGGFHAIRDVTLDIAPRKICALIGPSGCGKSTFLLCLNRMNDIIADCRVTGSVLLGEEDIYSPLCDVNDLRFRVGMVFQKPNPFPKSIYDNVAYGPRIHGMVKKRTETDEVVEHALTNAGLWNEVKDKLGMMGTQLSGGQQQRLCIARAIACKPQVILMDEPCSALDPIATARIEELMFELRRDYTIVIVTHSMHQAARTSHYIAFFHLGEMLEFGTTDDVFNRPRNEQTEAYITGRYG